jgi:hypothetical protein
MADTVKRGLRADLIGKRVENFGAAGPTRL